MSTYKAGSAKFQVSDTWITTDPVTFPFARSATATSASARATADGHALSHDGESLPACGGEIVAEQLGGRHALDDATRRALNHAASHPAA